MKRVVRLGSARITRVCVVGYLIVGKIGTDRHSVWEGNVAFELSHTEVRACNCRSVTENKNEKKNFLGPLGVSLCAAAMPSTLTRNLKGKAS